MAQKTDQAKGRAKEVTANLTGDKHLKSEGKAERRAGEVKEKLYHAQGKVEEAVDKAKDALHRK